MIKINDCREYQDHYGSLCKLRWLQVNELALKYENDQELGEKIRRLIKK